METLQLGQNFVKGKENTLKSASGLVHIMITHTYTM
jgi:hypothetical protein